MHEFAHVLDRADGAFDGTPELRALAHYRPWAEVMNEHFVKLRERRSAQRKALRSYGAENEAEFFAVATEAFFERPDRLREHLPDLYRELCRFYGCDPLGEAEPTA
jgi:Mlc titration factor MtfA (ptsG expression regulator)